ncbi:type IV pilus twitching motility protein PilT [Clostridium minihomine]|uniref:type IV pilus twitching motility protein PilT n=1 Tax=Clostridium minihomine TaxID=2045012 RepID=UPI000C782A1C|nr:PilT/PilU family type 4a pilus ATPase [Clostridium minihomine]
MEILEILQQAVIQKASDVFIISGCPVSFKINDIIHPINEDRLMPDDTRKLIDQIFQLTEQRDMNSFLNKGDDDFSFSIANLGRFRCNAYRQRNSFAAVLRVLGFELPDPSALHIPKTVIDLYKKEKGLVLITGSAGSGKSTTLACLIDKINSTRNNHIITIEDPLEFLHRHKKSIVSQREIANDTVGYVPALRAALRQAPDVILIGEMRDYETISTAMTAAETGQLILSTLHTVGAANSIDRIIDVFPQNQQHQIRVQLSMVLQAVISQQLIPSLDGNLVPAFEIMLVNSAIRNMIRESKTHQIDNTIYANSANGMITMDNDLLRLYKEGTISRESALTYCTNIELMDKKLNH